MVLEERARKMRERMQKTEKIKRGMSIKTGEKKVKKQKRKTTGVQGKMQTKPSISLFIALGLYYILNNKSVGALPLFMYFYLAIVAPGNK